MTIDELARRSGMTVRNIRAHQSRGLLPPPEIEGRTGFYGPEHVARLELIAEMPAVPRRSGPRCARPSTACARWPATPCSRSSASRCQRRPSRASARSRRAVLASVAAEDLAHDGGGRRKIGAEPVQQLAEAGAV